MQDVQWQDVKVGDIVAVYDDELIPADLLCLQTGSKDGVCYIKTTNLDGESNLKIRRPVQIEGGAFAAAVEEQGPEALLKMKGVLECEKPNADLHTLRVCLVPSPPVQRVLGFSADPTRASPPLPRPTKDPPFCSPLP